MKKMTFGNLLDPRDNRLPAKTGLGRRVRAIPTQPLANPRNLVNNMPGVRKMIAPSRVTNGKVLRQEQMETLNRAVDKINRYLSSVQMYKGLRFAVDPDSKKSIATLRDVQTGETLKTFPNETVLSIASNLRALVGLMQDRQE